MKIKILVGILIFLIVLNLATFGSYFYFRWTDDDHKHHRDKYHHRDSKSELTEEQRSKLHHLRREFFKTTKPYLQQRVEYRLEILDLMKERNIDTTEIYQKLEQISQVEKKIEKEAVNMIIEAREFLEPSQLAFIYKILGKYGNKINRRYMNKDKEKEDNNPGGKN